MIRGVYRPRFSQEGLAIELSSPGMDFGDVNLTNPDAVPRGEKGETYRTRKKARTNWFRCQRPPARNRTLQRATRLRLRGQIPEKYSRSPRTETQKQRGEGHEL
jgi:hypothetical protein